MIAEKEKLTKESKLNNAKDNKNDGHDKCPKNHKDCLKCKILDCPEEK